MKILSHRNLQGFRKLGLEQEKKDKIRQLKDNIIKLILMN